jgi:hypothetical protein
VMELHFDTFVPDAELDKIQRKMAN